MNIDMYTTKTAQFYFHVRGLAGFTVGDKHEMRYNFFIALNFLTLHESTYG